MWSHGLSSESVERGELTWCGVSSPKDTNPLVTGPHSYDLSNLNYFLILSTAALVRASTSEFGVHIHSVHNMQ